MKIIIETIPHKNQAYETAGDYIRTPDGTLHIFVSDTGSDIYNSLIGLHEWVEVMAMDAHKIPLIASTNFDIPYEKESEEGKHSETDEPGDDKACPYRREHSLASIVERLVAHDLEVDWQDYGESVNKL
jgi:hypothetical protein